MKLEELVIYQTSNELADKVWKLIAAWDSLNRETLGKELILAADQVAVNIAIGFGRYSNRDTKAYAYYSRGALFSTKTWLTKASQRDLINEEDLSMLLSDIDNLEIKLNNYIKSIGRGRKRRPDGNRNDSVVTDSEPDFDMEGFDK